MGVCEHSRNQTRPLEEQQVLQTTEPPPGPMYVFFTPYFVIKMLQGS